MKGDFSRDTFDPTKHFSRVLMQQGRVQLDADWNEQTAIVLHYLRTLAADLIGPFGGPAGDDQGHENCGFKIKINKEENTIEIGEGRYYVDGILCENDELRAYGSQIDLSALNTEKTYLVYLDVWERHVTAIEDDDIREKALNGPDTATRAQVVWQVKVDDGKTDGGKTDGGTDLKPSDIKNNNGNLDPEKWKGWTERWQPPHSGCLKAKVKPQAKSTTPCITAPDSKYRGAENQLYRVEIHRSGRATQDGQTATFKWSRNNGSVATLIKKSDGKELAIQNTRGFEVGQWIELTNDAQELRGEPGELIKLIEIEGDQLMLESAQNSPDEENWPTKARAWDAVMDIKEGTGDTDWIPLEDGIQIQFQPAHNEEQEQDNRYRTGDYWLIPARVATGKIEWPQKKVDSDYVQESIPPHGIRHHYAPLAILKQGGEPEDCRCIFTPLPFDKCYLYSYGEEGIGGRLLCSDGEEKQEE